MGFSFRMTNELIFCHAYSVQKCNVKPKIKMPGVVTHYTIPKCGVCILSILAKLSGIPRYIVVCPNFGHPALTSSFTRRKSLQVKNMFATIVNLSEPITLQQCKVGLKFCIRICIGIYFRHRVLYRIDIRIHLLTLDLDFMYNVHCTM